MNLDSSKQYTQNELPTDVFNANNGDIKTYNGQQVKVGVNGNGTRTLNPLTAMDLAAQAQQMQLSANQPAIATLNQQKTDLGTQYKSLLDSITASEQPALNSVTTATNNELGRRGITGDSGIAQNQIAQAQLPVTTQFGQLQANTGLSETQDLGAIANQIAQLQAGNVPNALQFGQGIISSQQQLQAAQAQAAAQVASAQAYANPQNYVVGAGGQLINRNGQSIGGNVTNAASLGGGGGYTYNTAGNSSPSKAITTATSLVNNTLAPPSYNPNTSAVSQAGRGNLSGALFLPNNIKLNSGVNNTGLSSLGAGYLSGSNSLGLR